MSEKIFACLDGSNLAEKILPLARAISAARRAQLVCLRVVADADELAAEEIYLRELARRYGAEARFLISADPATAIIAELEKNPDAIAAMTTHGRTAWAEAMLGSVAFTVMRKCARPVLLFRARPGGREAPDKIKTVVVALDGGNFSEKIIPVAADMAKSLAARLLLIQALPILSPIPEGLNEETVVVLEASYLHRKAAAIKGEHGIEAEWETLHGEPAAAICRYVSDTPETILAMTTHASAGFKRAVAGSVAGDCLRHAGVPMLIYWPPS